MLSICIRGLEIIWQLPQVIVGIITVVLAQARPIGNGIYLVNWRWASVSFGPIILLTNSVNKTILAHEQGHSQQSLLFGPFYLICIGLISIIRNIYFRIKGDWSGYYDAWPENDADRRGGVVR